MRFAISILRVEHLAPHAEIEHILPNGSCELMLIDESGEEYSLGLTRPGNGQQIVILTEQHRRAPSSCASTTSILRRRHPPGIFPLHLQDSPDGLSSFSDLSLEHKNSRSRC